MAEQMVRARASGAFDGAMRTKGDTWLVSPARAQYLAKRELVTIVGGETARTAAPAASVPDTAPTQPAKTAEPSSTPAKAPAKPRAARKSAGKKR